MDIKTIRKSLIAAAGVALLGAAILLPSSAGAAAATRHYGPIASTSPDSGSCGNNWATDTFERHFTVTVRPNADGTYNVTEAFKNGTFVTIAGNSPGGCDTNVGGTVDAGVTGKMHGSFDIVVASGAFNAAATCAVATDCDTTAAFIANVFGPSATYDVPTFEFHYSAGSNGEWKNASANRGGNNGDITGAP